MDDINAHDISKETSVSAKVLGVLLVLLEREGDVELEV